MKTILEIPFAKPIAYSEEKVNAIFKMLSHPKYKDIADIDNAKLELAVVTATAATGGR